MPTPVSISDRWIIYPIIGILSCFVIAGVLMDSLPLLLLPLAGVGVLAMLYNLEWPFLLLFLVLPLSWEQEFQNGFSSDIPTEPLMIMLLGVVLIFIIRNLHRINSSLVLHSISLILLAHYGWHWITTVFSESVFVSVKFTLAKTWYIGTFYFLAVILLRNESLYRRLFKAVLIPLFIVTSIILWRHSQEGFSFESANFVMSPFFRNHVTSAAMMSVFLPFVIYLLITTNKFLHKGFYVVSILVLLAGIYFSYTRAAHISVILSLAVWPMLHWRLTKVAIAIGLVSVGLFVASLVEDNKYLEYAPDFETTISHSSFEDLVSATYQGKDISTMERVYRWVAGMQMVYEHPMLGFGPGNFYNFYKRYTVTNFKTYVSDNPEKSGVHCYYLMVIIEQGIIGLIIFITLLIMALLTLEKLYHGATNLKERKLVVALAMSFTVIVLFQIINDLIETDKVGAFFFLTLAAITILDLKQNGQKIISEDRLAD